MAAIPKDAQRFYENYHKRFVVDEDRPFTKRALKGNRRIVRKLGIGKGMKLLDVSCGQGLLLKTAAERGAEVWGLDLSRLAIFRARRRVPGARLVVGNAEKLPFKTGFFDWVTCWGSLEHYANPEKALKEMRRVLKPEGQAAIYVPNLFFLGYIYFVALTGETPHEAGQNEYERFETRQGWEDMFARQGFVVKDIGKDNDMFASERLPRWMVWLYTLLVRPFVPLNLSYCFTFVLGKDSRRP